MEQVELGRTGRMVSRIGYGALALSFTGRPERGAAKKVMRRALELGINLIDTADVYCLHAGEVGHSERLVREVLREAGAGERVLVATKGGVERIGAQNRMNGRPWYLRQACERSLRALGVDTIDLYYLHGPAPGVPFEESVGALARLLEEGKVRTLGVCNVGLEQVRAAAGITTLTAVQAHFNPWDRSPETSGLLRYCHENGITFVQHSPVGGARRVGMLRQDEALRAFAGAHGASPEELVIAWALHKSPTLVPSPGASREASVESSVRAAGVRLDDAAVRELDAGFARLGRPARPVAEAAAR
ncbi:MAG TPA: aldo/keto reductase [Longimicrobiaceae bacterium]|nr:aldo/keto reductase [Longimicrobiaceae bacterium]